MTIEKVKHFFAAEGKAVIELSQSSATVELAARALNTEPARIAKTLSFAVNGSVVLVVAAGDMKIDNHKFKDYFHCKAKMLSAEEVLSATGHAVGGVCPFALPAPNRRFIWMYHCNALKRFFRPAAAAIRRLNWHRTNCSDMPARLHG